MTDTTAGEGVTDAVKLRALHILQDKVEGFDGLSAGKKTDIHKVLCQALAAQPSAGAQGVAWRPTTDELANCRASIAEARAGMARVMGDRVPAGMTETLIDADWLEKVCDHFATPAQPDTGDWSEYEDDIADAIEDSIDMDWTARIGAKAVVRWLKSQAMKGGSNA